MYVKQWLTSEDGSSGRRSRKRGANKEHARLPQLAARPSAGRGMLERARILLRRPHGQRGLLRAPEHPPPGLQLPVQPVHVCKVPRAGKEPWKRKRNPGKPQQGWEEFGGVHWPE